MIHPVKIHFRLVQDEDGYPPVAVESLWAQSGADSEEYVIDNVPFFARDATLGDTVLAREKEGHIWFEKLLHRSGNSLVRVVFFDQSCIERVSEHLASLGCSTEYLKGHNLLAVSIPNTVKLTSVQAALRTEARAGTIDYEESILRQ
jgi:Domain of unknown function (DUF4265)